MTADEQSSENSWETFQQELKEDLDVSRRSLKEISLMLDQSQAEMSKLTQRNSVITGHLQQVQSQYETMAREDIKAAYDAALEAQQRLLVMRSQLEKLLSDQAGLQRYVETLEKFQTKVFAEGNNSPSGRGGSGAAVLEMVVNAQEAERQRLSRQMHDGPAQTLSNFFIRTDIAYRLFEIDPAKAKEELSNLKKEAMSTFQEVRGFIQELRPMMLDDLGLFPTVQRYIETFREQNNVDVNLSIKGHERRLESYLEAMIFRAMQELMGNAVSHNKDHPIKIEINVELILEENWVRVSISDNGKGFNSDLVNDQDNLGLKLIRERVDMLGGKMEIESALGQGSRIAFQVPALETGAR
jgi:two-component system sensor histidine kinase DegS